jgi:3-hydroxyacyl-CoA dehydrogenase
MVARGEIGIRSGKGFYEWADRDPAPVQADANRRLQRLLAFLEEESKESGAK